MNYLCRLQPWLYYVFLILASAVFWLRPALVAIYDVLYGPAVGDAYLRVNGIYFPILWFLYVVYALSLVVSLTCVIDTGGAKHWLLLILSGIFVAYFTLFHVIFDGIPGEMLG